MSLNVLLGQIKFVIAYKCLYSAMRSSQKHPKGNTLKIYIFNYALYMRTLSNIWGVFSILTAKVEIKFKYEIDWIMKHAYAGNLLTNYKSILSFNFTEAPS